MTGDSSPYLPPRLGLVGVLREALLASRQRLANAEFWLDYDRRRGRSPSPIREADRNEAAKLVARWESELREAGVEP